MNCRDFERAWNDRLDTRGTLALESARALAAHAAACPACRGRAALLQAIAAGETAPVVPLGFADRCLAAWAHPEPIRDIQPWRWHAVGGLAAAAALFLAIGLRWRADAPEPFVVVPPAQVEGPSDADSLTSALADATAASWTLARAASAPAARVGREVLGASALPGPFAPAPPEIATAEVWRDVGARVNEGVQPLGGTARHAFGFLFSSLPVADEAPKGPAEGA